MTTMIFWGEKGEYGPFTAQDNGWPNAGEVIRHYRRKLKMSAEELARQYGEAIGEQVTARWILKMEQQNKVPTNITRRQALTKILHVPPVLLGIASLEQVLPKQNAPEITPTKAPAVLKQRIAVDISMYEREIRTFWLLNETSHAHNVMSDVLAAIQELEALERQSSGELLRHTRELLYSYYRLVSRVHRDLLELPTAYRYANQAVRVTKVLGRGDLIATSLFVRGFIRLIWGMHGEKAAFGIIETQREKLIEALSDFEQAFPLARPQLKGLLQLEMSRVQALLSGSAFESSIALRTIEAAGKLVDVEERSHDPYTSILLDARVKGLDEEEYLLGRAITFNTVGRPGKALEAFDEIERLDERKRREKDQTRHYAWLEIVQAQAYLGTKEYYLATDKAINAFLVLRDLDSLDNIAFIQVMYHDLLKSPYRGHEEVKELGTLLARYYQTRQRKRL